MSATLSMVNPEAPPVADASSEPVVLQPQGGTLAESTSGYGNGSQSADFRVALENSREGFAITDSAGRFVYMNQAHAELFGYANQDELCGEHWGRLYDAAEMGKIEREIFPEMVSRGWWSGHLPAKKKDGSLFHEDLTLSLLPSGGILCNCRDRTAEVNLQDAVEGSERMLRAVIDELPIGVAIRNAAGVCQFVNGHLLKLFGVKENTLIGQVEHLRQDPVYESLCAICAKGSDYVFSTGKIHTQEIQFAVGGVSRNLRITQLLIPGASARENKLCTVVADLTQQHQLENELRAVSERRREYLEMQREFTSMVSHEFRTPITAIQGAHYLLKTHFIEEKLPTQPTAKGPGKWLRLQGDALHILKDLVDQVLLLNRIEHMTGDETLTSMDVSLLVKRIIGGFNDATATPRVVLVDEREAELTGAVKPSLVHAAVENLISNGLKYSAPTARVTVQLRETQHEWSVRVCDVGKGIPASEQSKLFHPFFRASNVGVVPGTGLGLAIVKRAVDFHRGRVDFNSEENVGTCFTLYFPKQISVPDEGSKNPFKASA